METDLTHLPFDHFQRYGTAVAVLKRLGSERLRILEVGANRQRLLSRAFPDADILYTDIVASGDDADLVLASAAALPFSDAAFDAVVCLDVLEHIPAHLRDSAVQEMARVAARLVIIGCPTDTSWVNDAESSVNACWAELFGGQYPWLAEHQEFGLVDAGAVESLLEAQLPYLRRVSQGAPGLWSALMAAHFMKERTPSLGPLVACLDHLYNTAVFDGDFPEEGYREYFIGLRRETDAVRVSDWLARSKDLDAGVVAFLETIPEVIRPVLDGIVRTEDAWTSAVHMYQDQQRDLTTTKDEWGKTAVVLEQVRADVARLQRDYGIAQAGWEEALAALVPLRDREASLVSDLGVAQAGWEETLAVVAPLRDREASLVSDLGVAQAGWEEAVMTLASLRDREASLAQDLGVAKAGWEEAVTTLASLRDRETSLIQDLDIARAGWEETVGALETSRLGATSLAHDLDIARAGWEEAMTTLHATRADLLRSQDEIDHLHVDLDTAKREWSATAQLLDSAQTESRTRVMELESRLAEAHGRHQDAERRSQTAIVERTRAVYALVTVVVASIAGMTAIALF